MKAPTRIKLPAAVLAAVVTGIGGIIIATISAVAAIRQEKDQYTEDLVQKFKKLGGIEIESGAYTGNSGAGWALDRRDGPQSSPTWDTGPWHRERVTFSRAFTRPPKVLVNIIGFEFDKGQNARLVVGAEKVDNKGFTLVMHTWGDTKVLQARASWLAYYQPGS